MSKFSFYNINRPSIHICNIKKQLVVNHVHAFKYCWRLRRKGRRTTFISYFGMSKECKEKSAMPMDSSTTCSPIIFFRFLLHNAISMRANQKEWLIREYCLRCNLLFIDRVPCFHLQCRLGERRTRRIACEPSLPTLNDIEFAEGQQKLRTL